MLCVRCGKPVELTAQYYNVQEQMHWLCFHLEFEHEGDPDSPCGDPSCPWLHIQFFKEKLQALNINPEQVILDAFLKRLAS